MELFAQQGCNYQSAVTIHKELFEVLLRDDLRMFQQERSCTQGITPLEVERGIAHLTAASESFSMAAES